MSNGYQPIGVEEGQYLVYHDSENGGTARENMVLMVKYLNDGDERIDQMGDLTEEMKHELARYYLKELLEKCGVDAYNHDLEGVW